MRARYVQDHGDRMTVGPSAEDAIARGTLLSFVLAPLVLVSASTAAWIVADDDLSFLVGWGVGALTSGALAFAGLWAMATAERRAARSGVRIDLAERTLARPDLPVEVLRDVEVVDVRVGRWPWSGFTLSLVDGDGRPTPLCDAPRWQGRDLARAAAELSDALGATAEVGAAAGAPGLLPRDPRIASALCYVPIDGFAQGLCLFYLMTTRDPFVRFNAQQSLLLAALELIVAASLGAGGLLLALAVSDRAGAAALACPLIAFAGARVTLRTVAALRARRGRVWIQPWLAPISRAWAPR